MLKIPVDTWAPTQGRRQTHKEQADTHKDAHTHTHTRILNSKTLKLSFYPSGLNSLSNTEHKSPVRLCGHAVLLGKLRWVKLVSNEALGFGGLAHIDIMLVVCF